MNKDAKFLAEAYEGIRHKFVDESPEELRDEPTPEEKAEVNAEINREREKFPFECKHCGASIIWRDAVKDEWKYGPNKKVPMEFDPVKKEKEHECMMIKIHARHAWEDKYKPKNTFQHRPVSRFGKHYY